MSRAATDWAWRLQIKPAALKLVLLSMADRADEYHCCYPSMKRLGADTGLDKKTITNYIGALEREGIILDTGRRVGATKRVRVFQLAGVDGDRGAINLRGKLTPPKPNEPENGAISGNESYPQIDPKTEPSQKRNDSENGSLNRPENGSLNGSKNGSLNQSMNQSVEPYRSIQSPAPGIDPVGEAFQNVFWPLWEGRKYARGECLKIFAELVEQSGVSPMDFAKQLAADFNARIKFAQKGFDKMHPKSYLKGRRWEDQAPVTGTTPIPKVSESKKLHNRMASIQSEINSETLYMNGIRDNDPLRLTLRESAERKINRLNDELETCRQRLKELNKGLPGSEIYS